MAKPKKKSQFEQMNKRSLFGIVEINLKVFFMYFLFCIYLVAVAATRFQNMGNEGENY